uniref:Uncharacterized protein n=1 Tax=viral metagenome TaxID=1070528 RepID=A0A6C0DR07_9ZZZZ
MEPSVCKNIRSRRHPDRRCPNPATNGDYCGVHYKFPRPFQTQSQIGLRKSSESNDIVIPVDPVEPTRRIQRWWALYRGLRGFNRQGPARWLRTASTNSADFYSMEEITDISGSYVFSFADTDKIVYAFDIRSFATLLEKAGKEPPQNPYNRQPIAARTVTKALAYIKWSRKHGIDTRWAPIEPTTPDQQFGLRVTDLFQKIDELSYYTNTAWFTGMSADDHRCFYVELHDIWFHRAELSNEMRNTIIPPPARPFRLLIREVVALKSLEILRKTNLDLIRMFVSAATDRSDRSLGAMYVLTAMTLVNQDCAAQYPWMFESATPGIYARYRLFNTPAPTANLMQLLMGGGGGNQIIPLALPPPALEQQLLGNLLALLNAPPENEGE